MHSAHPHIFPPLTGLAPIPASLRPSIPRLNFLPHHRRRRNNNLACPRTPRTIRCPPRPPLPTAPAPVRTPRRHGLLNGRIHRPPGTLRRIVLAQLRRIRVSEEGDELPEEPFHSCAARAYRCETDFQVRQTLTHAIPKIGILISPREEFDKDMQSEGADARYGDAKAEEGNVHCFAAEGHLQVMQDPCRHDDDGEIGDKHDRNRGVRVLCRVETCARLAVVPELGYGRALEGADEGGGDGKEAVDGEDGPEGDVDAAVGGA